MKVPVSKPLFGEMEKKYVGQALAESAVSGVFGAFIPRFEAAFAEFCGVEHAICCSNGTAALHLLLVASGIKKGDEILVSTLTNMATIFAILYCGAHPIPVDVDPKTLNLCPIDLERKVTDQTKGLLVVHLFGHPADMGAIQQICNQRNIPIFEDCAEAHGAEFASRIVGGFGLGGAFSFFSNKILQCGEGGMVTTNDPQIADRARSLRSLSFGRDEKFMHEDVGFNYRLSNLHAAMGLGQVESSASLIDRRIKIVNRYKAALVDLERRGLIELPIQNENCKSVYWMCHLKLKGAAEGNRAVIANELQGRGVETRPGFIPANLQNVFSSFSWAGASSCPVASRFAYSTFYVPTGPDITDEEIDYVSEQVLEVFSRY